MSLYRGMVACRFVPPCSIRLDCTMLHCTRLINGDAKLMSVLNEKPSARVGDAYLRVNGNGSSNIANALFVRLRTHRIFVNCGPSRENLRKGHLNYIFVTHLDWSKIGGIINILYKAKSSKQEEITVCGPLGLDVFLRAAENFLRLDNLKVRILNSSDLKHHDSHIKSVPLYSKNRKIHKPCKINKKWIKLHYKFKRWNLLQSTLGRSWILSECVKRGVKPGENMPKLWRGESVILEDGSVVQPEDVIQHPSFTNILIIDVPSEDYIEDLVQKQEYEEFYSTNKTSIIIHFSPQNVMNDRRYISWMQRFSVSTKHLIVNESNGWETPKRALNRQEICRLISPQFFPKLISNRKRTSTDQPYYVLLNPLAEEVSQSYIPEENTVEWLQGWKNIPKDIQLIQSWPGTCVNFKHLEPFRECQPYMVSEEPSKSRKVFNCFSKTSPENPKITFLGTGSQGNSAYRNSSGILLEFGSDCSMLFDCGDGMMHQIACLYNKQEREKLISSIKCIFISHTHADHHADLIGVLLAIKNCKISKKQRNKVLVLLPPCYLDWLETYHNKFEPILDDVIPISLDIMATRSDRTNVEVNSLFQSHMGIKKVLACYARHSFFSYSVTFQHDSDWKISYSGDSQPNKEFARIGKYSDLLIHEATFGTGLDMMAREAKHSTTEDAIAVGKEMCAKQIILTHFSKRYPTIPCLKDLERTSNVSIAFDFLQCHLKDFKYLPELNQSYRRVFATFEAENREEHERLTTRESLLSGLAPSKVDELK